jgi:hypothetical protein
MQQPAMPSSERVPGVRDVGQTAFARVEAMHISIPPDETISWQTTPSVGVFVYGAGRHDVGTRRRRSFTSHRETSLGVLRDVELGAARLEPSAAANENPTGRYLATFAFLIAPIAPPSPGYFR